MTRKDFRVIAEALVKTRDSKPLSPERQDCLRDLIDNLIVGLEQQAINFRSDKFRNYI